MLDSFLFRSSVETQSVTEFMNLQVGLYPEYTIKTFIIPLLRHFTIFGQENGQNMSRNFVYTIKLLTMNQIKDIM